MLKLIVLLLFIYCGLISNAQIQPIPNVEESQKINQNLKPNGDFDLFQNLSHPLAITGCLFVLGGAATYVVGSELDHSKYSPDNTTQFVGIGLFAAGAVFFTDFSAERNENAPKRK
ncbi:MAG: hypothetical protein QMB65_05495 [Vicingaceae bacterium]